ncbi:MAG: thioredoxin domain-containing protein [Sphingorhabdus sp.]
MRVSRLFRTRRFGAVFNGALVLIGSAALAAAPAKSAWLLTFNVSPVGGHIIGNPAAPTKLVEYASYTCGHCGSFETNDAPALKNQFVAGGKVSFEIRNLVRDEVDLTAAMLARCGGKGRFFGNHRHLMATQAQWADDRKITPTTIAKLEAQDIFGFMLGAHTELGLDKVMLARGVTKAQSKVCLRDAAALDAILKMTDEAVGPLGIKGTPTFMVNGKIVEAHDLMSLKPLLTP